MNPIGLLLASRSLDLALTHEPDPRPADPPLGPIASTPETAAAWRRWRDAGASGTPVAPVTGLPAGRPAAPVPGRSPG